MSKKISRRYAPPQCRNCAVLKKKAKTAQFKFDTPIMGVGLQLQCTISQLQMHNFIARLERDFFSIFCKKFYEMSLFVFSSEAALSFSHKNTPHHHLIFTNNFLLIVNNNIVYDCDNLK